jgi:hypothetical protein
LFPICRHGGLSKNHENAGTFKRLKKSMSRMAARRKNKTVPPEAAPDVVAEETTGPVVPASGRAEKGQRNLAPPVSRQWEVNSELRTFSDTLHEVLHVHGVIERSRKSLKAAEKLTKTLKEQSSASLEISKQDFGPSGNIDNATGKTGVRTTFRQLPTHAESQKLLDSLEQNIRHSTVDTIEMAIDRMMRVRSDIQTSTKAPEKNTALGDRLHLLADLDSLTTRLCRSLIEKDDSNKGVCVGQIDRVARLLGKLASPRIQLQYLLNYHSNRMRQKLSSNIVSLSVPDTFHFSLEEGGNKSPSRISSDIGFAMMGMLLDAEEQVHHLIDPHSNPSLERIFAQWVQTRVKETCDVLLRLVVLPMATPMGLFVVSRCLALFQAYCRAVECALKVPIQNTVMSVLYRPFIDLLERKVEQHNFLVSSEQSFQAECAPIMNCLQSNAFIMGHRLSETRVWAATILAEVRYIIYLSGLVSQSTFLGVCMQRCVARIKPSSDPDSSALVERLRDSIAVVNL